MKNYDSTEDLGAALMVIIDKKTGKLVLVLDEKKHSPHYWKFPGGKTERIDIDPSHPYDDEKIADTTAKRETEEETGLQVTIIHRLKPVQKTSHVLYARLATVENLDRLAKRGDEGELVKAFDLQEILDMDDFMPSHVDFLNEVLDYLDVRV